jgi:hypothetical protein
MAEYLLIGLTLAVAIIGILWDRPGRYAQIILIILVVAASAASIFKLREDNDDKKFLQLALTSTLVPTHSGYDHFYRDFDTPAKAQGFDVKNFTCHHSEDGLMCFFASPDKSKHGTLVLNKAEVAEMYANQIRGKSNSSFSEALFKKQFTPSVGNEEFLDKAGIVGFLTFYNVSGRFPANYYYDDSFGVKVIWDDAGSKKEVVISPADVSGMPAGSGLDVFRKIQELYRERFKAAGVASN